MTDSIQAIFKDGVIRPLESTSLVEGEEIEVVLIKRRTPGAAQILAQIAAMEVENPSGSFSGEDHDQLLYPTS